MRFEEVPDYGFLRNLFKQQLTMSRLAEDNVFDWMQQRVSMPAPAASSRLQLYEHAQAGPSMHHLPMSDFVEMTSKLTHATHALDLKTKMLEALQKYDYVA